MKAFRELCEDVKRRTRQSWSALTAAEQRALALVAGLFLLGAVVKVLRILIEG